MRTNFCHTNTRSDWLTGKVQERWRKDCDKARQLHSIPTDFCNLPMSLEKTKTAKAGLVPHRLGTRPELILKTALVSYCFSLLKSLSQVYRCRSAFYAYLCILFYAMFNDRWNLYHSTAAYNLGLSANVLRLIVYYLFYSI